MVAGGLDDASVRERALAAVGSFVDEHGSGPSFAEVADRAGLDVGTLRARWRTSTMLVIDALDEDSERGDYGVEITGDLRRDLTEAGVQLRRYLSTARGACLLRTVIVAYANPLEPLSMKDGVIARRLSGMQELLDAAGETHLTVRDLVDGLIAPIFLRTTTTPASRRADIAVTPHVDRLLSIAGSRTLDGVGGPR